MSNRLKTEATARAYQSAIKAIAAVSGDCAMRMDTRNAFRCTAATLDLLYFPEDSLRAMRHVQACHPEASSAVTAIEAFVASTDTRGEQAEAAQ